MYKMGTDDGRTGLPENNELHDYSEAVGADSGISNNRDNQKSAPGSSSGNVKSEIDDYIESLWMLVMTRWENTSDLLAGSGIIQQVSTPDPSDLLGAPGIIRQVSEELKRLANFSNFSKPKPMRTNSNPTMLKYIRQDTTWVALEKRFDNLTKYTNGLLPRSCFWECIGMNKDSQEFAEELFDALTLRRNIIGDSIDKYHMKDFWEQISDQSFDSRLQTFFDMIDKDADGRITQDDVRKIISLSASTNKLSNIQNQADEYAALIMEELDPDDLGYIMIENLEMLLLQTPTHNMRGESLVLNQMLSLKLKTTQSGNPIRRWYEDFSFPKVLINGPYGGAPAQYYKKYEVVLLVGSGTPIINILKDILNNIKAKEDEDNALENGSTGKLQKKKSGSTNFKTTRAYLYWVTSEQRSFDMVKDIMNEAAEMDNYGVIEMHAYCTSVFEEDDARSAFITVLQSLYHARNGIDVVSGTRVKSCFAEPNWHDLYKQIAVNHTGSRIGVFYCGESAPAKQLKQLAHDFSQKTATKFDFHKQNF